MDREYWEIRLQAYVDNELEPADRKAVEDYMNEHPDFRKQAESLRALKSRLQAHAEDVQIPSSVEARLQGMFDDKGVVKLPAKRNWNMFYAVAAIAAVLLLAVLTPNVLQDPYEFQDTIVVGEVICPGCVISERTGLAKNDLCESGHILGIETETGELYQFADDAGSQKYRGDWSFYKQKVRVEGKLLKQERLLRVDSLEQIVTTSAHNHGIGHLLNRGNVLLAP
jgi:hypothetical protein